ncbi:MAG: hypothetical protein JWL77_3448 [Chthonomonadaceae bacterium]|nr:hypothetical protein [Chthonomonadaceae bacterium]
MLVEFTVGNFRSIAERVTLSMVAGPIKSAPYAQCIDEENVIRIDDRLSLLKTAAIYGANASGKSNILRALLTMGSFMDASVRALENSQVPFKPFMLISGYADEPSYFEIVLLIDGLQYRYGFEISASRVEREWLYFVPTVREALLFRREGDEIKVGDNFRGGKGLESRVAPKALFLTVARDFNVHIAKNIFHWINRFPSMSGLNDATNMFTIQCLEEKKLNVEIIDFITRLDVDISDIEVFEMSTKNDGNDMERDGMPSKAYRVDTIHKSYDRQGNPVSDVRFNMLAQESEGTRKLFSMAGKIVEVLKHGHILAIDEMDARLHPSLTRKIVELFHSRVSNPKNAQLIFATHDTNLLDNRLFRRDQIWFTEKNRMGATDLYSLAELKVRNDASYERDYIDGRYGAIPFPGSFDHIFDPGEMTDVTKG